MDSANTVQDMMKFSVRLRTQASKQPALIQEGKISLLSSVSIVFVDIEISGSVILLGIMECWEILED
jgi:hypothetical protein